VVRIGVVGFGEWGPNHVRNFSSISGVKVAGVADGRAERLQAAQQQFEGLQVFPTHHELFDRAELDAVAIATPTSTHAAIIRDALDRGLHVLCEKPICSNVADAEDIVARADRAGRVVMVGHVFLFNSGIRKLRQILVDKELGDIRYLTARRTNLGPIRDDVNAAWDLASHDISIVNFLLDSHPVQVSAVGHGYLDRPLQDVAFFTLTYPNGVLANVHASWLDPVKVREITAVGTAKMVVWNDLGSMGPIQIFDKGVVRGRRYADFGDFQLLARQGDVTIPHVPMEEPLRAQARAFVAALTSGSAGISDARCGLAVVKVLDAIDRSMARGGAPVDVGDVGDVVAPVDAASAMNVTRA
jgi:predicted dehydrogenase